MSLLKKLSLASALTCALLSTSFHASAALQSLDWKSNGDQLITLDTSNGLGWLDLSQTGGDSMVTALNRFSGWRLATMFEVQSLHSTYFGTPFGGFSLFSKPGLWSTRADTFMSFFGRSYSSGNDLNYLRYSYGLYQDDDGVIKAAGVRREYSYANAINHTNWGVGNWPAAISLGTSYENENFGVYLVRDNVESWLASPVSSSGVFIPGVLLLLAARRSLLSISS